MVAFPAPNEERKRRFAEFLEGEAQEISSQLTALIDRADELARELNLETVRHWPQLSSLMQFLAHAMRVSGEENVAEQTLTSGGRT